jgi:hypothetical protein
MIGRFKGNNRESGFVSLFTVIFFMLLITVITIGFLRIMGIEQQQSLNNDLTASAINAAQSGIEDGQRAILAYNNTTDPTLKAALATALTNNTQCDALTSSPTIRTALNLDNGGNVIGNSQLNQYYTCLTVSLNTPNYINSLPGDQSDIVPLIDDGGAGFERVKVSWHLLSTSIDKDGDGVPTTYASTNALAPLVNINGNPTNSWSSRGYPAYLRVQLFGYPNNVAFNRADIEARTYTMILVPALDTVPTAADENTPINFATVDPRGFDQAKNDLQLIKCKASPGSNLGSYACAATLELPNVAALRGPNNSYFLRVTPVYGQSHFQVVMYHNGVPVNFKGVQPIVDATGRAADVYRRVQSRVRNFPGGLLPEYALESANTICKNMIISDGTYFVPNTCP